jgi:hypothetical protein
VQQAVALHGIVGRMGNRLPTRRTDITRVRAAMRRAEAIGAITLLASASAEIPLP